MFKTIVHRCALILALMFLTASASHMQAQSGIAAPAAVTGGDPQPTGEPPPKPGAKAAMPIVVLTTLIALGLA